MNLPGSTQAELSRRPEKQSLFSVVKEAMREFPEDQCTDLAAALTYYAVLALFPAMIVMVSLLGVFGQGRTTVDALLKIAGQVGPSSAVDSLRPTIETLSQVPGARCQVPASPLTKQSSYRPGAPVTSTKQLKNARPNWTRRAP